MKIRHIMALGMTALLASACADQGGPITDQMGGTVLGGAAGAVAGAQFGRGTGKLATTAIGAVGGALIGNSVGSTLDKANQAAAGNPPPVQVIQAPPAQPQIQILPQIIGPANCHEFTQPISVGYGRYQPGYGVACQQPNGGWVIQQPASLVPPSPPVVYGAPGYYAAPAYVEPGTVVYGDGYYHGRHW